MNDGNAIPPVATGQQSRAEPVPAWGFGSQPAEQTQASRRPGRFGASTPGIRPDRLDLEGLVSQPEPGRRRPWRKLVAIAAVLGVAGAGYAAGHFITSAGSPHLVKLVVTSTALPQGARLAPADLRVVEVTAAAAPAGALDPDGAAGSIGLVTDRPVPAGTFLTRSLLVAGGALPGPGQAQVGLALKPGQLPAGGLADGQRALVVLLPQSAQGVPLRPVPLASATVWAVSGSASAGVVSVTVLVPAYLVTELVGYASRGQVALVATFAGTPQAHPSPSPAPTQTRTPSPRGTHRKSK